MKLTGKILAVFAILVATLTGCGDSEKSSKLVIAVEESYVPYFEEAAKAYTEKTGVEVVVEETKMFDFLDALPNQQGNAADIFMAPVDRVGDLASQKLITDIEIDLSEYIDNAQGASNYDGKDYMLPLSADTTLLIRNTDIIADAPATLKELGVENFQAKFTDFYFAAGMFMDTGAYLFGDESTDLGLNNADAVKAGENIQSLYQSGNEAWSVIQDDTVAYDVIMDNFLSGEVGAIINGPWALADIEAAGINYEVSVIPSFDGTGNYKALSGVKGLVVNGYSSVKKDAEDFLNFIATGEYASKWAEMTAEVSPHTAVEYAEGSTNAIVFDAVSNGEVMPNNPNFGKVWEPMKIALQQISMGEDVKTSLDAAVEAIVIEIEATE